MAEKSDAAVAAATPETAEQMQLLRHRVRRMDELIDGILQYSRAGRMDSRGEPVVLAQPSVEPTRW